MFLLMTEIYLKEENSPLFYSCVMSYNNKSIINNQKKGENRCLFQKEDSYVIFVGIPQQ